MARDPAQSPQSAGTGETSPLVISLIGLHNVGKTTVGERMTRHWTEAGLRVAVLKHEGTHPSEPTGRTSSVDWEKPGSDTQRYAKAGAVCTVISGMGQSLWRVTQDVDADNAEALVTRLEQFLSLGSERPHVILVEGFKSSSLPKVAVLQTEDDVAWLQSCPLKPVVAVIVPEPFACLARGSWRVYHDTDIGQICTDLIHQPWVGDTP